MEHRVPAARSAVEGEAAVVAGGTLCLVVVEEAGSSAVLVAVDVVIGAEEARCGRDGLEVVVGRAISSTVKGICRTSCARLVCAFGQGNLSRGCGTSRREI